MKMVDADLVSAQDLEVQQVLKAHPSMSYHLAILTNGYRNLIKLCASGEMDQADIARSLAKSEAAMRRMGIPVLETPQDWIELRRKR